MHTLQIRIILGTITAFCILSCHKPAGEAVNAAPETQPLNWSLGDPSPPSFSKIGEDRLPNIIVFSFAGNGKFNDVVTYFSDFLGKEWRLRASDSKSAIFVKSSPQSAKTLQLGLAVQPSPDPALGKFLLVMNLVEK
jgi:hypothetical protein